MDFSPVEFIFKDPKTQTKEEIAEFNLTRSFFLIQKINNNSVNDIIEQVQFEDLYTDLKTYAGWYQDPGYVLKNQFTCVMLLWRVFRIQVPKILWHAWQLI